jgi:uncharacterized membrane protein YqjE
MRLIIIIIIVVIIIIFIVIIIMVLILWYKDDKIYSNGVISQHMHNMCILCICWEITANITENARNNTRKDYSNGFTILILQLQVNTCFCRFIKLQ